MTKRYLNQGIGKDRLIVALDKMVKRIAAGCDKAKVILIGGMSLNYKLLNSGNNDFTRNTRDLDLSIEDMETYKYLFDNMEDILNTDDGDSYEVTYRSGFNERSKSESMHISYNDNIISNNYELKVDMNIKQVSEVNRVKLPNSDLLLCDDYYALVDKLAVVCSDKVGRRLKDMYDIFVYSNISDVCYSKLVACMQERRPWMLDGLENNMLPERFDKFKSSYEAGHFTNIEFDVVFRRVSLFVVPLVDMINNNYDGKATWSVRAGCWYGAE